MADERQQLKAFIAQVSIYPIDEMTTQQAQHLQTQHSISITDAIDWAIHEKLYSDWIVVAFDRRILPNAEPIGTFITKARSSREDNASVEDGSQKLLPITPELDRWEQVLTSRLDAQLFKLNSWNPITGDRVRIYQQSCIGLAIGVAFSKNAVPFFQPGPRTEHPPLDLQQMLMNAIGAHPLAMMIQVLNSDGSGKFKLEIAGVAVFVQLDRDRDSAGQSRSVMQEIAIVTQQAVTQQITQPITQQLTTQQAFLRSNDVPPSHDTLPSNPAPIPTFLNSSFLNSSFLNSPFLNSSFSSLYPPPPESANLDQVINPIDFNLPPILEPRVIPQTGDKTIYSLTPIANPIGTSSIFPIPTNTFDKTGKRDHNDHDYQNHHQSHHDGKNGKTTSIFNNPQAIIRINLQHVPKLASGTNPSQDRTPQEFVINDTWVFGGVEDEEITVGEGNYFIDAGPGKDTVVGGEGQDLFVLARGDGETTIFNYQDHDRFGLLETLNYADLMIQKVSHPDNAQSVQICDRLTKDVLAIVHGTTPEQLTADHFIKVLYVNAIDQHSTQGNQNRSSSENDNENGSENGSTIVPQDWANLYRPGSSLEIPRMMPNSIAKPVATDLSKI